MWCKCCLIFLLLLPFISPQTNFPEENNKDNDNDNSNDNDNDNDNDTGSGFQKTDISLAASSKGNVTAGCSVSLTWLKINPQLFIPRLPPVRAQDYITTSTPWERASSQTGQPWPARQLMTLPVRPCSAASPSPPAQWDQGWLAQYVLYNQP